MTTLEYTTAAEDTRWGEVKFSFLIAGAMIFAAILLIAILLIVGGVMGVAWGTIQIGIGVVVALMGFAVSGSLMTGALRGWILSGRILGQLNKYLQSRHEKKPETTTPLPAATNLPTSAADPREIPLNVNGRAGGTIALDFVNGFHPKDLEYIAKYLANGNKFSENALQFMPLPHEGILFGGAVPGTPLTRLLDLCEQKGILSPRDPSRRKSGKLLITDEREILRLLKEK